MSGDSDLVRRFTDAVYGYSDAEDWDLVVKLDADVAKHKDRQFVFCSEMEKNGNLDSDTGIKQMKVEDLDAPNVLTVSQLKNFVAYEKEVKEEAASVCYDAKELPRVWVESQGNIRQEVRQVFRQIQSRHAEMAREVNEGVSSLKNTRRGDNMTVGERIQTYKDAMEKLQKVADKLDATERIKPDVKTYQESLIRHIEKSDLDNKAEILKELGADKSSASLNTQLDVRPIV